MDSGREVHVPSSGIGEGMSHVCENAPGTVNFWGDYPQYPQELVPLLQGHVVGGRCYFLKCYMHLDLSLLGQAQQLRNCVNVSPQYGLIHRLGGVPFPWFLFRGWSPNYLCLPLW